MASTRKKWLAWIPAGILSLAIVGVVLASSLLIGGGLGGPAPKPTEGQVTELNWSSFTPEGLAYIASSRKVRIDMSRAPVQAAPLGLDDNGSLTLEPIDNIDTVLDYDLIVNGGGEGYGGGRFVSSTITIVTENGVVTLLSTTLREVLNFRETLAMLQGKADLWGWDVSGTDEIFATVEAATRAGETYEFTFGPADKAGVPVAATARCDTTGYCLVEYTVTPAVR